MRNYKNEREWQKKKYDFIQAKIDKSLGTELRLKLKQHNKSIASWITEKTKQYLEPK